GILLPTGGLTMGKAAAKAIFMLWLGGLGMASPTDAKPWISEKESQQVLAPVKKLIDAQKYNAALGETDKLLNHKDEKIRLLGLSLRMQLTLGMHKPET